MAKMKIYEIAKSLNTKSGDLVKVLNDNGFDVKSHNSNIEDDAIAFIIKNFAPKRNEKTAVNNGAGGKKEKPKEELRQETKPETKQETKQESRQEIKQESKQEIRQEIKQEIKQESIRETKQEIKEESKQESKEESIRIYDEREKRTIINENIGADKKPVEKTMKSIPELKIQELSEEKKEERKPEKDSREPGSYHKRQNGNQESSNNRQNDGSQGNNNNRSGNGNQRNYGNRQNDGSQGNYNNRQGNGNQRSYGNHQNNEGQRSYSNRSESGGQGGYNNRPEGGNQGGYNNRQGSGSQGGYNNRSESGNQGGYSNRQGNGNQGGYNNRQGSGNQGGYNNRQGSGNQGGYNNRQGSGNQGGYNNRPEGGSQGGYNNRQGSGNQGGYNNRQGSGSQGGYNNRQGSGNQGGYNNRQGSGNQGGYNNRPGGGQGGYNNRQEGGYNRSGNAEQGGYNNRQNSGGQGGYNNRSGGNQGGFNKQRSNFDKPVFEAKPLEKTAQRKNDKGKRVADKNKNSKYKDNDISNIKAKKDPNRKGAFIKPVIAPTVMESADGIRTIEISEVLTLRELAEKMKLPVATIVKKLFLEGKVYSINQEITFEEAEEIALEFNFITEKEEVVDVIEELLKEEEEEEAVMSKRPPVVCVMGHVDHGKTSLLDAIRKTSVTEREAGGITQHIGAYMVEASGEMITFLDTPGHEAFTSMRMRGAKSTDIAILVVAADDGVMPQTVEAISHARAAEVEIIVAINKIDKPGANIERVKQELAEHELIAEDWGGSTVFVPVSAKTGDGIDHLLEMVILTSEVLELKANANRMARGIVIEAQLDKGRGPVATILVQKGTLNVGDSIVIGSAYGKVRAMMDDKLRRVKEAKPSTPVEILGLNEVPDAGEIFMVTENDKEARNIAEAYIKKGREKLLSDTKAKLSLDGLFSQIQAGNVKELNIIIKADVQGSVEAVKQSLLKLSNEEVTVRIVHGGVGAINESDVNLASTSNAIIIGFNVRPDPTAKESADREKVDLRLYKVIYKAIEDIEAAMKGMLDPIFEEKVIGHAVIRQVFKASKVGNIAGSYVLDGKIFRDSKIRITRDTEQIYEGNLASLKRFKDDVKEVAANYECGLVFEGFDSVQEDDMVEIYVMEEVPR